MAFTLNESNLRRLFEINSFPIAEDGMVFLGLRGCILLEVDNQKFQLEHQLTLAPTDYLHPRCTLGQWLPKEGMIAFFPGSTVPHRKYIKTSLEKEGRGTNQLMTGYYDDYRKGTHKHGSPTGHEAFRQTEGHPIRRTADDFDFDEDDRVEFTNPYDNIHSAWSMGIDHNSYASAGCQVIVGYPKCEKRDNEPEVGPWRFFRENAYRVPQDTFPYMLLNAIDAKRVALSDTAKTPARLRFGSQGALVESVQGALKKKGYYEGDIDGDFGRRTLRAALDYQTAAFGPHADDGIIGPITADSLKINWPNL